ncbi:hypothetical protein HDV62DRAFT_333880 [Trichoderma sp. SZMC 28011]
MHSTSDASKDRPLLATPYARLAGRRFSQLLTRGISPLHPTWERAVACESRQAGCMPPELRSEMLRGERNRDSTGQKKTHGYHAGFRSRTRAFASHRIASHRATAGAYNLIWGSVSSSHSLAVSTLIKARDTYCAIPNGDLHCIRGLPVPILLVLLQLSGPAGRRATGDAWHALFNNHVLAGIKPMERRSFDSFVTIRRNSNSIFLSAKVSSISQVAGRGRGKKAKLPSTHRRYR